jgi:GNAT superfamily N-acetyltransferase
MSDADLAEAITAEGTEIFVAYANGVPGGFFELEWRDGQDMWLAYFGIMPEFRGRGLGKWLLSEALAAAWLREPERVRVETCTLDDPRALPLYQRMGFVPYERRHKVIEA